MLVGVLMLFLGRRVVGRQNLVRGGLLAAIVVVHLLWRRAYYGAWLPNTFSAKTGDLGGQLVAGSRYLRDYLVQCGSVLWLGLFGLAIGLATRRRDVLAVAALALAVCGEVLVVGGETVSDYRMLAPFEPLCFLLIDLGARTIADRRDLAANLALAVFAVFTLAGRRDKFHAAEERLFGKDMPFWDRAAGGAARWLLDNGRPGVIALGDIGRDRLRDRLSGPGSARPGRPRDREASWRIHAQARPGVQWPVLREDAGVFCAHLVQHRLPAAERAGLSGDLRRPHFLPAYEVGKTIPLDRGFAWCIYRKR